MSHVSPPFVVKSILLALSTAHPTWSFEKWTERISSFVPEDWCRQESPPSVVARMVPASPTAHPRFGSTNCTARKSDWSSVGRSVQDRPPLVVTSIVPPLPTDQPCWALTKLTDSRLDFTGALCICQVAPPLVVARMTPAVPTTQPLSGSTKCTLYRSFPVTGGRKFGLRSKGSVHQFHEKKAEERARKAGRSHANHVVSTKANPTNAVQVFRCERVGHFPECVTCRLSNKNRFEGAFQPNTWATERLPKFTPWS